MKRYAAMIGVAFAAKLAADLLPDAAVAAVFTRPAACLAAIYWNAAFDAAQVTIRAAGVTLAVVRACSATDFFAMCFALLAFSLPVRRLALRVPAALAAAWAAAVLANAARLALMVVVAARFPGAEIPAVHMAVGVSVFLPVFALLWYTLAVKADRKVFRQDLQD